MEQVVPMPETLLDSCWKVVLEIRGVKSDKNRVPVRLTFCCKFSSDDNILEVEQNHQFVKRYVPQTCSFCTWYENRPAVRQADTSSTEISRALTLVVSQVIFDCGPALLSCYS